MTLASRRGTSEYVDHAWQAPRPYVASGPDPDSAYCQDLIATGFDSGCDIDTPPQPDDDAPAEDEPAQPAAQDEEPQVDPTTVALSVIANIQFAGGTPQVGPPPTLNDWDMAVVGYPLWLWTDGPTSLTASASEQGLEVSLDARATSVTFDLGDGTTLTCDPTTARAWTAAVPAQQPSPTCGHTYTRRSAGPDNPGTPYTVTATTTWEVAWTAADESGVEIVRRSASTDLVVGELQALVTG